MATSMTKRIRLSIVSLIIIVLVGTFSVTIWYSNRSATSSSSSSLPSPSLPSSAYVDDSSTDYENGAVTDGMITSGCVSGTYRVSESAYESEVCQKCPVNHWCSGGIKHECINGAQSSIGSESEDQCYCPIGTEYNVKTEDERNGYDPSCYPCRMRGYCSTNYYFHAHQGGACPRYASWWGGDYQRQCETAGVFACDTAAGDHGIWSQSWTSPFGSTSRDNCTCAYGSHPIRNAATGMIEECQPCPASYTCYDGQRHECPRTSSDGTAPSCDCAHHQWWNPRIKECATCSAGTHRDRRLTEPSADDWLKRDGCQICPLNSYCPGADRRYICWSGARSPAGSESISDCVCDIGEYDHTYDPPMADGPDRECVQCKRGFYCPTRGIDPPVSCTPSDAIPGSWTSPPGSTSPSNCTCASDFYPVIHDDGKQRCERCLPGFNCHDGRLHRCAENGRYCYCDPGSYWDPATSSCHRCPHDHWCHQSEKYSCASGAQTLTDGRTHPKDCRCTQPGYVAIIIRAGARTMLDTCQPCPMNHYCNNGATVPYACPNHMITLTTQSQSIDDCITGGI